MYLFYIFLHFIFYKILRFIAETEICNAAQKSI